MGRRPCCKKEGLNRGAWSAREDKVLISYINTHGEGKWRDLPQRAGLMRCGKSCRLRWMNYLRPDIKRGNISVEEEELIVKLHKLLGNRWSLIAGRLPGRTDNEIKNYWNTNLRKRGRAVADKTQGCGHKTFKKSTRTNSSSMKLDPVEESHQVIRTKAVRCNKVVIVNIPGMNCNNDQTVVGESTETSPCSAATASAIQEQDSNDDNEDDLLLMDFDINQLLISSDVDLSLSGDGDDFRNQLMMDADYCYNGFDHNMSFDQPDSAKFGELVLDETRLQNGDVIDLKCLEKLLNSEDNRCINC